MWTIGGQRIYVQDISDSVKQIIADLQPLAGGTIHQVFGYETLKVKVNCLVVGKANLDALQALTTSGVSFLLDSPEGSLGNFLVDSVTSQRDKSYYQTIDTTQSCYAPVYVVDLDLKLDS